MELFPSLWVEKYKIKNESGLPIEFDSHNFLRQIYDDLSPLQVILKPPQVGMTVCQTIKSFYIAKKKGKQIIYTLPTQNDVEAMAGVTINRLVAQNPILSEWVKDHDTVGQKSVGNSIINYRGTWSAKQAMMIPSDLNIHDEVDASDSEVILQYETRLQAKADGMRWYFSHPSLVGRGVDKYWEQSDKKEWFIKCNHCNEEQQLKWPENIDPVRKEYICSICGGLLSNTARRYGRWQTTSSGLFSGYHISQLMCTWITAAKIIDDWEHKDKQYFWNYVLGLPYVDSGDKISSDVILSNVTSDENLQQPRVIIGVDTGLPIHFVCMNKDGVFYYNTIEKPADAKPDWDAYATLEKLLNHFDKSILVADQGGDLIGIRRLQAKFPGRVFLCFYRKDRKTKEIIKWGDNEAYGTVVVDRNRMISLTVEHLRQIGYIRLNGKREEWELFASHFDNIYRELVEQKETIGKDAHTLYGNEYIWKRMGADHFVHALVYALVGFDKYGEALATVVKRDEGFMKGVQTASKVDGTIPAAQVIRKGVSSVPKGTYTPDF